MNCITHHHAESVAACGICGAGLCQECHSGSPYTWNGRPLCPSCNVRLVSELLEEARAEAASARFRVLFFAVAMAIGAVLATVSGNSAMVLGLASLGAIPTMWRLTRPTPSESIEYAVQDGVEQAFGDYSGGFIRFLIRIILVLALSGIAGIILFFVALWKWRKAARKAAELEADLALMQGAGWRAHGDAKSSAPEDPKKAALVRAVHFAGPWKRVAVPAPCAAVPADRPASDRKDVSTQPAAPEDRIAARMAEVDARIAARKAAIESGRNSASHV